MNTEDKYKPEQVPDPEHPGYETSDIHVGGILVFLAGLGGSVLVLFVFSFAMGKVINRALQRQDGVADRWHQQALPLNGMRQPGQRLENLASSPKIQQEQLQVVTSQFPQPRLEADDGNQDTADLHAREDLLLEHYSSVEGRPGVVRIPIERAMELIARRGLPTAPQTAQSAAMTGADAPVAQAPLTNGFARTGFELTQIKAREEKMMYAETAAGD